MDGSGMEMFLRQETMDRIRREDVRNKVIFSPDMNQTEQMLPQIY